MEDHLTAPPCEHSSNRRQQRVHQAAVVPGVSRLERRGPAGPIQPRNPPVFKSDRRTIATEHGLTDAGAACSLLMRTSGQCPVSRETSNSLEESPVTSEP